MRLKPSLKFSWLLPKKPAGPKPNLGGTDDAALASHLAAIDDESYDFTAVVISLSKLEGKDFDKEQADIAANAFRSYVAHCGGEVFYLSNRDIVYIYDGKNRADVHEAVRRLKSFFRNDSFFKNGDAQQFSRWFELKEKGDELAGYAQQQLAGGQGLADHIENMLDRDMDRVLPQQAFIREIVTEDAPSKRTMTMDLFVKLNDYLAGADLSSYLKPQPVCAMTPAFRPQLIFQELKLDLHAIKQTVAPDVDPYASPWLLRELNKTIDKRLLAILKRDRHVFPNLSFSFSLSIATMETIDWQELTAHFQSLHPWPRIVQIDFLDALSDLRRYFRLCAKLKEFGYRICLNNIRFVHLPLLDRNYLQANMIRLMCTETLKNLTDQVRKDLGQFIDKNGPNRVILFNCDDKKSCKIGYDLGITLFQGQFIDHLLDA